MRFGIQTNNALSHPSGDQGSQAEVEGVVGSQWGLSLARDLARVGGLSPCDIRRREFHHGSEHQTVQRGDCVTSVGRIENPRPKMPEPVQYR